MQNCHFWNAKRTILECKMHHFGTHNLLLGIILAFNEELEVLYLLIINHLQKIQMQVSEVWFCLKNNCLRHLLLHVSAPHSFQDFHNLIEERRISSPSPREVCCQLPICRLSVSISWQGKFYRSP